MNKSSLFFRCLAVSAVFHACLLVAVPYKVLSYQPVQPPLEIAYVQSFGREQDEKEISPEPLPAIETKTPPEPFVERKDFVGDFLKTEIFKPKKIQPPAKVDTPDVVKKRSVQTPSIPGETFQTPEYKSYYQIIREKIRKQAYRNYRRLEEGEVFLTFILSPSGELIESSVNHDKSTGGLYLRQIALESVRSSAPFPEFPPKLKNKDRLSFNVIISFELK